jgi:hypothetical protein
VKKDKKQLRSETKEEHWCNTAIEIKNKIEGRRRNRKEREEREEQAGRRERRQRGEETKAATIISGFRTKHLGRSWWIIPVKYLCNIVLPLF